MIGCHAKYEESHFIEGCDTPPYCPACPTKTFKLQAGHEYGHNQLLTFASPGVLAPWAPGDDWCALTQCAVDATEWAEDCNKTVWTQGKGPWQGLHLPEGATYDDLVIAAAGAKCCFLIEDANCLYDQKLPPCNQEEGGEK